ncbi:PqqD family protein [Halomonas urumqiensis]|uniref:PqqD family protein n=1 Tax=Halomonas urumqiensis TaxID=1684789 RepID=UPI0015E0BDEC|nr:PqqD family protein [Halomonas urumqiensis]
MDIHLPGLGRLLRLSGCPEVADALVAAMPGWPMRVTPASGLAPAIRLRRAYDGEGDENGGYVQHAPGLRGGLVLPTPVAAVCSLIADIVAALCERRAELIGLHCGSVEIEGQLVLFPASHRAGKSTLTAAFAAAGCRVFGDDVLALTAEGDGMALGISPRLRLPLPDIANPDLVAYAERHAGPEDPRYRYLSLPEAELAAHGERRPIGAIVLLERDDTLCDPDLVTLAPGEGLLQLLCQNFSHDVPTEALMTRFAPLMTRLPCLLLRYSEPLAAAQCLMARMTSGRIVAGNVSASLLGRHSVPGERLPSGWDKVALDERFGPCPGVRDYPVGEELFLIDTASGALHRLNSSGQAAWRLLGEEALTVADVADLLVEHHGDVSKPDVEADVQALFGWMVEARLIESR